VKDRDELTLPVHDQEASAGDDERPPSCSPAAFVSNEESAIVKAMQKLREQAVAIRKRLAAGAGDDTEELERRLAELRDQWAVLAVGREKAYIRKMVMLGHLPPEALVD